MDEAPQAVRSSASQAAAVLLRHGEPQDQSLSACGSIQRFGFRMIKNVWTGYSTQIGTPEALRKYAVFLGELAGPGQPVGFWNLFAFTQSLHLCLAKRRD